MNTELYEVWCGWSLESYLPVSLAKAQSLKTELENDGYVGVTIAKYEA